MPRRRAIHAWWRRCCRFSVRCSATLRAATTGRGAKPSAPSRRHADTVAKCLSARSATEVVFTSGASEGNNLALIGTARGLGAGRRHLVTQATEHPSVLEPLRWLERSGWELTVVGVDGGGRIRLDELDEALRDDTAILSLMLANNETGTIQPVREAAEMVHRRGALLHCDAAQGAGKITFDVDELGVDLLTVSSHKVCGPKGIGALYLRRSTPPLKLTPVIHGGGHENGLRSGTPNVPGAVGLARALEIAVGEVAEDAARMAAAPRPFRICGPRRSRALHCERIDLPPSPKHQQSLICRDRGRRSPRLLARSRHQHGVGLFLE